MKNIKELIKARIKDAEQALKENEDYADAVPEDSESVEYNTGFDRGVIWALNGVLAGIEKENKQEART